MPTTEQIGSYYTDLTTVYAREGAGTQGWHMGLWEPGVTTTAEALLASNQRLLAGLSIDSHTRILDVGCGVGALAIWAARTFGCHVTGISIVPMHIAYARIWAALAGVRHLCDFVPMDMAELAFPEASFDVVTNQESWCHTPDKRAYLQQVYRVLRPGGRWRALDGAVREKPLPLRGELWHREVCAGWHIYPLLPGSEVERVVRELGYVPDATEDLTERITPHVRQWLDARAGPARAAMNRELAGDLHRAASYRGHAQAGLACARGLVHGYFRYHRYSAAKPDAPR